MSKFADLKYLTTATPVNSVAENDDSKQREDFSNMIFLSRNEKGRLDIDYGRYINFLKAVGFYRYYTGENFVLAREQNKMAELVRDDEISKVFEDFFPEGELRSFVIKQFTSLSTKARFNFLPILEPIQSIDTLKTTNLFFRNGIVEVGLTGVEIKDYSTLNKPIWKKQIIEFDIEIEDDINELSRGDFYQFCMRVCADDHDRFFSLMSAIGYLINGAIDKSQQLAIVLMDEKMKAVEEELNGGTGKTMIGDAIMLMRKNSSNVKGKSLRQDNRFALQSVQPDSQIIVVNEVRKDFKFDDYFYDITEGVEIERKFKDSIIIKGVKFLLTTNHVLKGLGAAHARRKFEFPLANHYDENLKPVDEFGRRLMGNEWDHQQWHLFYNLMIYACSYFLKYGLEKYYHKDMLRKRLLEEIGYPEFTNFAMSNYESNVKYNKHEMFNKLSNSIGSDNYSIWRFTKNNNTYARLFGYEYREDGGTNNSNPVFWFEPL